MTALMRFKRVGNALGSFLSIWCVAFAGFILLTIQSFTATIVPSVSGRDTPGIWSLVGAVVLVFVLTVGGGTIAWMSTGQPSRVLGRQSLIRMLVLLVFSVLALVRAVLGIGPLVSGDAGVLAVVAEVWFTVAGLGGLGLWAAMQAQRRELQQHRQRT